MDPYKRWSSDRVPLDTTRLAIYFFVLATSGLGLLGKMPLLVRVVPLPAAVLKLGIAVAVCLPLLWKLAYRLRRILAPLVLLGVVVASLLVYPRMEALHSIGRGSDQPDCVIVAAQGLVHGEWPYQPARMWSHDSMSCGPGWVAVQAPVTVGLGYRYNLLALWAVSVVLMVRTIGWSQTEAALSLMALTPAFWVSASDGTDFLPFGILFAALLLAAHNHGLGRPLLFLAVGLVSQFRYPTIFAPALFGGKTTRLQRTAVVLFAVACELAFLLWRSQAYIADGPLHLFYKLTGSHLLASNRALATLEIAAISAFALALATWLQRLLRWEWSVLLYLLVLFVFPSALDLRAKIHVNGGIIAGLGVWEGANWMSGCIPMCALMVVEVLTREKRSPAAEPVTVQGMLTD